jgi:hypothetical protein
MVSAGFVGAAIASVSLVGFVVVQALFGTALASVLAIAWAIAACGRIALMRRRSRVAPIEMEQS